jgi:hypothetical protein
MAITFLQAVNASLKRVGVIQGDAGELATSTVTSTATGLIATGAFTDSGRQVQIDLMIQVWNEAQHILYDTGLLAQEAASATLILATDTREYDMPSDFERFAGKDRSTRVFRAATTVWHLTEYPGGYEAMLRDQNVATDWIGQPRHYAISPVTRGRVRIDRTPDDSVAGRTYNALYEKRLALTSTMATETLNFSDTVADALVPVTAEAWSGIRKQEFDSSVFAANLARAAGHVRQTQARSRGGVRRAGGRGVRTVR